MKKIFNLKYIILSVFFISSAGIFTSCDDWTTPESLDIEVPNIADENNALYQQYLENLRNYKESYHQLLIGWFDNSDKSFVSRGMHVASVPDKTDIISLMAPDNLTNLELDEIAVLRNDKGTKVIYTIDYDAIARNITAIIAAAEDEAAAVEPGNPEVIVPDFYELLEAELDRQFALLSKYNYDGLCIGYIGFSNQFPTVADLELLTRTQNMIFERLERLTPGVLLFAGLPENLLDRTRLFQFDYIVVQTQSAADINHFTVLANASIQAGVPADRIIVSVYPPSLDPSDVKTGYFVEGNSPTILGAAQWLKMPGNITKAGLAIYRINDDYYNSQSDYKYTRDAIDIMNPSPQK